MRPENLTFVRNTLVQSGELTIVAGFHLSMHPGRLVSSFHTCSKFSVLMVELFSLQDNLDSDVSSSGARPSGWMRVCALSVCFLTSVHLWVRLL